MEKESKKKMEKEEVAIKELQDKYHILEVLYN
jgi:hypothetical protein